MRKKAIQWYYCCWYYFDVSLGKYGCPNCEGKKAAKLVTRGTA